MTDIVPYESEWWDLGHNLLFRGVPDQVYHKRRERLSNSTVKMARKSWAHAVTQPEGERGVVAAFKVGSASHSAVFEPDLFEGTYARFEGDRRRKADKERYEGLKSLGYNDWTILSDKDYTRVLGIREAVYSHDIARGLVDVPGETELTAFWEWEGVRCKSRYDKFVFEGVDRPYIVDLKTTQDASPKAFLYDALRKYRYDWQAAYYLESLRFHGVEDADFYFVAVESNAPFGVTTYKVPQEIIDGAWAEIRPLLEEYKQCKQQNHFPSYPQEILDLSWDALAA